MTTAVVNILSLPFHVKNDYTYLALGELAEKLFVGAFVTVPFGRLDKIMTGVVRSIGEAEEISIGTKCISGMYDPVFSLSGDLYRLCEYISDQTVCSFSEAVKAVFPQSFLGVPDEFYSVTDKLPSDDFNETVKLVYAFIASSKNGVYLLKIYDEFGRNVAAVLAYLRENGYVKREMRPVGAPKTEKVFYYTLNAAVEYAKSKTKSAFTKQAIDILSTLGETEKSVLCEKSGISATMLDKMVKLDLFSVRIEERLRNPYKFRKNDEVKVTLTDEQSQAVREIDELCLAEKPAAVLLHGVTGSGKTQVIKAVCDRVISRGKSVIILVPEISLTPQSVKIFCAAYGERVVVMHSALSQSERADAYRKIKKGDADIVIGTRSAVFAPFDNIGLIVIDEEQEHTYKSEMTPKYHARDAARFRCNEHNAVMLLASATPSVESYYKAQTGKYKLIKLKSRFGKAQLPKVVIADLKEDYATGATDAIGTVLKGEIVENKRRGNQSVLFLNRRGYSNFLSCRMCGEVVMCPHCDVSLTYHTTSRLRQYTAEELKEEYLEKKKKGYLLCHYCGYRVNIPEKCSKCGSPHIAYMGHGTQKICDDIADYGYDISVLRMDADTTSKKFSYDRILTDFREHEADVLLGTQMVTKGHDFPDVTLVGVILADSSLYVADYHATEHTFSLLTQVVGRAGRADKPGVAVIQTFNPDNEIIRLAANQDYEGFYKGEIALRKALKFPPFCDVAVFMFTSDVEVLLTRCVSEFYLDLMEILGGEYNDVKLQIFGPVEAPIHRLNGRWRMQMIVKCKLNKRTRELFRKLMKDFTEKNPSKVTVGISVNPTSL